MEKQILPRWFSWLAVVSLVIMVLGEPEPKPDRGPEYHLSRQGFYVDNGKLLRKVKK